MPKKPLVRMRARDFIKETVQRESQTKCQKSSPCARARPFSARHAATAKREKVTKKLHVRMRARDPDMQQQKHAPKSEITNGTGATPDSHQPPVRNGTLRRATTLRINWHKHWTGDQLSEKVCPEHQRDARPFAAYFGVVNVINNR